MRVAAAELEASDDDNKDGEDGNESSDDSSEGDGSGSQADGQDDGDEGWEDEEDEGGTTTQSKRRKWPKVMSVIEKVRSRSIPPSLSLLIFFGQKSSTRKYVASFENSVHQSIIILFLSAA
jgi:hypothetical protein